MSVPKAKQAIMTPSSAMLVFIAPALLAIAQLVSGDLTSGVWNFLEGALGVLCVLYAVVIPWFATRSFRLLRTALAKETETGAAQIVALRSSEHRYGRFAVLVIDSSVTRIYQTSTSVETLAWSEVATLRKVHTGILGRVSVMAHGHGGQCLLDFIPMGNSGIETLGARRLEDYVARIVRLRPLNSLLK